MSNTNKHVAKFRGFHEDGNGNKKIFIDNQWITGYWVYGTHIVMHDPNDQTNLYHYIIPDGDNLPFGAKVEDLLTEIIPETVGQCIELTDKNNKIIYEDDVLNVERHPKVEYTARVVWIKEVAAFGMKYKLQYWKGTDTLDEFAKTETQIKNWNRNRDPVFRTSEIIGNAYENPELLNEL